MLLWLHAHRKRARDSKKNEQIEPVQMEVKLHCSHFLSISESTAKSTWFFISTKEPTDRYNGHFVMQTFFLLRQNDANFLKSSSQKWKNERPVLTNDTYTQKMTQSVNHFYYQQFGHKPHRIRIAMVHIQWCEREPFEFITTSRFTLHGIYIV